MDDGRTILGSLEEGTGTPYLPNESHRAILDALAGKSAKGGNERGYGLRTSVRIVTALGGEVLIVSGRGAVVIDRNGRVSAYRLRLRHQLGGDSRRASAFRGEQKSKSLRLGGREWEAVMTRPDATKRVKISEEVGPLLMLRSNVAPLFRKIATLDQTKVILDFTAVEFMSRSFADEYLTAKAASGKTIEERAVPVQVCGCSRSSRASSPPGDPLEIRPTAATKRTGQ